MATSGAARNPFYLLLLLAGLLFVVTALACAVVPVLEQKAIDAGNPPPPSALRDALRAEGWKWLLYEVAAVVALALACMIWDHRRSLQNPPPHDTISPQTPHHPEGRPRSHEDEQVG